MATRLPPLLDRAILFAQVGPAAGREDVRSGYGTALDAGATGLSADVCTTRDGHLILSSDGVLRRFPRRRLRDVDLVDIPESFVRLEEFYEMVPAGTAVIVSVDGATAGGRVVDVAVGHGAASSLWLVHSEPSVLAGWRRQAAEVRLVNATTIEALPIGAERRAAELAADRIDAVMLPETDWTGGFGTLFHRFEVLAFASGARFEHQFARLIDLGVDAVVGDDAERMSAVAATFA